MSAFRIVKLLASGAAMTAVAFCVADGFIFGQVQDDQVVDRGASIIVQPGEDVGSATSTTDSCEANDSGFAPVYEPGKIQLCQGCDECESAAVSTGPAIPMVASNSCNGNCGSECLICGEDGSPVRAIMGVDGACANGREPTWRDQRLIPWEAFAYGEYIGPHRTPDVGEYRIRVNDQIEFVYLLTREKTVGPYQLYVGDEIQIISSIDPSLNQTNIGVLSDGTISLPLIGQVNAAGKSVEGLQKELNEKYTQYVKNPAIVVRVIKANTPLQDLRDSVDSRFGAGGQGRLAVVSPDGTVQLPLIGSIPAVGLTLEEIRREVNARYRARIHGIEVTPILSQRAPRFVYVVGEVEVPGRFELTGPTTAMQALALAEGTTLGANVRQIVVFRRDQNWKLVATRLDLSGPLYGRRPHPSDDIWLRDSDIVLIPKSPILRLSEQANLYFTFTLYSILPQQGNFVFGFDNISTF